MLSEHAALVCWNHVFNVDICILSSMFLKYFQSFLNQIRQVFILSLGVVNLVPDIYLVKLKLHLLFLNMLKTGRICL